MRGSIQRRGAHSWRIKFDLVPINGKRQTRYVTVTGTRKDAEAKLAEFLHKSNRGTLVDASKSTVGAYLGEWLEGKHNLSPVTKERYADAITKAIIPDLG